MHARQQLGQAVLKSLGAAGGVSVTNVSHIEVLTPDLSATIVSVFFEDNEGARQEQLRAAEQIATGKVSVAFQGQHLLAKPIPRKEARADTTTGHTCGCSKCRKELSSICLQLNQQEQQLSDLADIVEQDAAASLSHITRHKDQLDKHVGRLDHLYHVTGTPFEADPADLAVRDESTIRRTASQTSAGKEQTHLEADVEGSLSPTLSNKSPCPRPVRVAYRGNGEQRQKLTYTVPTISGGPADSALGAAGLDGLGLRLVVAAPTVGMGDAVQLQSQGDGGFVDDSSDSPPPALAAGGKRSFGGAGPPPLPSQYWRNNGGGGERPQSLHSSSISVSSGSDGKSVAPSGSTVAWKRSQVDEILDEGTPTLSPVVRSRSPVLRKPNCVAPLTRLEFNGGDSGTITSLPVERRSGNGTPPSRVRDWYSEQAMLPLNSQT